MPCLNLLPDYNNLLLDYNNLLLDYNNLLPDYNKPIIIYYYYNPRININPSCPVLVRKNLWKKVLNEEIPVNKYQKKINHMSKLKEMMLIILKR